MTVSIGSATHPGRRSSNEDAVRVDVTCGLAVLADGMGGHRAGEVAAEIAVSTIQRAMIDTSARTADGLRAAVLEANRQILTAAGDSPFLAGMGTTVAAVLLHERGFDFLSVGDSRVYRLSHGHLTQLTRDDSWLEYVRQSGANLAPDCARDHPMRHVLTSALGLRLDLHVDVHSSELGPDDVLMLCTDGLHDVIDAGHLESRLAVMDYLADAADGLVADALEAGANDNISVVLIRVDE